MARENKNIGGFLVGVVVGGVVGGLTAMLLTPWSGRKLRKNISRKTETIIDDVNSYVEAGKEKADELFKEGKKKADSIISEAKKIVSST